jgi:hypothetical protein
MVDGLFQGLYTAKSPTSDHSFGDESKPTLHLIEPGTAGRREMKMEAAAFFAFAPSLDQRAFVRTVVPGSSDDRTTGTGRRAKV